MKISLAPSALAILVQIWRRYISIYTSRSLTHWLNKQETESIAKLNQTSSSSSNDRKINVYNF